MDRGRKPRNLTDLGRGEEVCVRSLEGRIGAIALAHSALSSGEGAYLHQLVEAAISSQVPLAEQVDIAGPDLELDAKAYTAMALVIHELV